MKTKILAAAGLILIGSSTIGFSGLVARFKFNDTLNDETGNHNGSMAAMPTFAPGMDGDALSISSADEAVEVANPQTLDFGKDFSVAAWVQTGYPGEQVVIYRGDPANFVSPALQLNVHGPSFFIYGDNQGSFGASYTNIAVNDGNWHHLAVTYSASGSPHFTLYLDGIPEKPGDPGTSFAGDFVTATNQPNSVVRIGGRDAASPDYHFNGLLDEVQIYDQPLSTDQVQFLFKNAGSIVQPPAIPVILTQPQTNQVVAVGGTATFTVVAQALTPPAYQWQFKNHDLNGATNSTLTLTNVTPDQGGTYTVRVSTAAGSTNSNPALLVVGGAPELSVHMYAGLTIAGTPGLNYRLDYQDGLKPSTNWLVWTNLTLSSSPYLIFDVTSTNTFERFYRAVIVP